jgi:small-conductance mechanosensitive channel
MAFWDIDTTRSIRVEYFEHLLSLPVFRNSLLQWLTALGIMLALFSVLLALRRWIRRSHQRLKDTPETELAEILSRTTIPFFVVLCLYAGLKTLSTGASTARLLDSAITIALFWQAGVWIAAAANGMLDRRRRRALTVDRAVAGSLGVIGFIVQVIIWTMVGLLTLDNLGVDVTALVAGLGIGGIAVALAVQNILGDLFASLSITFDQPFVVGDFLAVGDFLGSVEYIGIKSTRLRSLNGEQIVISNADLLGSRVRNYGRMAERRVLFSLGVIYETPAAELERIPGMIRRIVEAQQDTRFDRAHFAKHGAASLDFEIVYYVLSADYNRYMDIQQAMNLQIHREFERAGIEFAYPTQKVILERPDARREAA